MPLVKNQPNRRSNQRPARARRSIAYCSEVIMTGCLMIEHPERMDPYADPYAETRNGQIRPSTSSTGPLSGSMRRVASIVRTRRASSWSFVRHGSCAADLPNSDRW